MFSLRGLGLFILLLTVSSGDGSEIINGEEAKPHSLPFMALLESAAPCCGGTLIHPQWVLTAAHCCPHYRINTVLLGVHSIKAKESEKDFRQVRNVIRNYSHPDFIAETYDNDLMLLKLDHPVEETEWVKPLPLKGYVQDPSAGTKCLVAGWGKTEKIENMSDVLRFVYVTVIDRLTCNSSDYYNSEITDNMMCAGSDGENVADTCSGDSGGPILCNNDLVGVTSHGTECGIIKKPGVYTFLTENLLSWITNIMTTSDIK